MLHVTDVKHAHEVIGADLFHLLLNLFRDAIGIARDKIAAFNEAVVIHLGKIQAVAVARAEVIEGPLRYQSCRQLLVHGSFVKRFVEAAIKN